MICILHFKYVTRNIWNVYSTIYGCAEATMRTFFIYKKEGTNYWKLNRNWNYLVHWTYATVSLFLLFYFWNSVFIMSNKSKHNRIEFTSVLPHHRRHHHHKLLDRYCCHRYKSFEFNWRRCIKTIEPSCFYSQAAEAPVATSAAKVDWFLQLKLNDNAIKWMSISYVGDNDDDVHEATIYFKQKPKKIFSYTQIHTHRMIRF